MWGESHWVNYSVFAPVVQLFYFTAAPWLSYLGKGWGELEKCNLLFQLACGSKIPLKSLSREEGRQLSECDFQVQCKYIQLSIHYITNNSLSDYASKWNLLANLYIHILGIFVTIPRSSQFTNWHSSTSKDAQHIPMVLVYCVPV